MPSIASSSNESNRSPPTGSWPYLHSMMEILTDEDFTEKTDKEPFQVTTKLAQSPGILGLPVELLKQIISILPFTSIPNTIVNQFLRPICEQCLYEWIVLPSHPWKTLRLLETFTLRPDLALLVRHLDIDVRWVNRWGQARNGTPDVLKLGGAQALSLAKNIISLKIRVFGNWMEDLAYAALRGVVSNLTLESLTIPDFSDLIIEKEGRDRGIVSTIRAQPRLKHLHFPLHDMSDQLSSTLQISLLPSDVPNLKALKAFPKSAIPFLGVASGLESLSLLGGRWNEELFSRLQVSSTTSRSSLRCLAMRVSHDDGWLWANLDKILALFPNTETLCLTVNAFTMGDGQPAEHFFRKIENYAHVLRSLESVEIRYDSFSTNLSEVAIESMVAFKQRCPLLKTIITPRDQIWQFCQDQKDVTDPVPKFVGTI